MKKTAVVIMAAGIGSRFGGGIKQLEPVGANGECIIDFSIYDAIEAGFNEVVFIIRKEIEQDFKHIVGNRIEKTVPVKYVFQELNSLPEGYQKPAERTKPWGTGHAILGCRDVVRDPFVVINADDYYGKSSFVKIHDYLIREEPANSCNFCMAGFTLEHTLSRNGFVTRGICQVNDDTKLIGIAETYNIKKQEDGTIVGEDHKGNPVILSEKNKVSMNMWGLTPGIFEELEIGFERFLNQLTTTDVGSEYLLPIIIDDMVKKTKAEVTVLETQETWFGVTYKEDKQEVMEAIQQMKTDGIYKEHLFQLK